MYLGQLVINKAPCMSVCVWGKCNGVLQESYKTWNYRNGLCLVTGGIRLPFSFTVYIPSRVKLLSFLVSVYTYESEKAMAPHCSTLAWKIPWMEEPGRLQSMGSRRVGHDWATSLSLFIFIHWRRKWQPIPVFLPGESQGWGSLVGCRLWGHTESDMTEVT